MWVSTDLQHISLFNARHISILVDGTPGRSTCGQPSQLEVCQLLQLGSEVVYPEGLNGGLELVWVTLPKLPIWEAESTGKATQLQITLPRTTQGDSPKAIPVWLLMLVSSPHSVTECPSERVAGPSMMEEIEELLLNHMFEMPGESSMYTSPRRPPFTAPNDPAASREEIPPDPGENFQVTWSSHLHPHMGLHRQVWLMSQPIPAAPPHWVCQRGIPAPLLSSHRPTPSTCWTLCYTFKRRWMTLWFTYSLPGPW